MQLQAAPPSNFALREQIVAAGVVVAKEAITTAGNALTVMPAPCPVPQAMILRERRQES